MDKQYSNAGNTNAFVYRAKIDLLYFLIFIIVEVAILIAIFLVLTKGFSPLNLVLVGFFVIIGIGIVWMFLGIRYIVDDRWLKIQMGPFRTKILLSEIQSISPARSILSSWAVSVDRLKLRTRKGVYEISPTRPEGFTQIIHKRNPAVRTGNTKTQT